VRRVVRAAYGVLPLAWSHDSKRFIADGGDGAYVFNVRTGRRHVIVTTDNVEAATIGPDGTMVLAESFREGDLYSVPPGTFTEHDLYFGAFPVWGPGGLAHEVDNHGTDDPNQYSDIVVRRHLLSAPRTVLHTTSDYASPIGWSADGATLLAAEVSTRDGAPTPTATAVLITPKTGATRTLGPAFSAVSALSRDGRHVLAEQNGDVVTANEAGTVRLLAQNASHPSWTR